MPPPPTKVDPAAVHMKRPFKKQVLLGAEHMRQDVIRHGIAPPPPSPMVVKQQQPMAFKKQIALAAADITRRMRQRGVLKQEFKEELVQTANLKHAAHYPPLPPAEPAPELVTDAPTDHPIGTDVAKEAERMRAEHYPPRAPAAPAPKHVEGSPVWHPVKEDIKQAAQHMHEAHRPPLPPTEPAPMIVRQEPLQSTLKEELKRAVSEREKRAGATAKTATPLQQPSASLTITATVIEQDVLLVKDEAKKQKKKEKEKQLHAPETAAQIHPAQAPSITTTRPTGTGQYMMEPKVKLDEETAVPLAPGVVAPLVPGESQFRIGRFRVHKVDR